VDPDAISLSAHVSDPDGDSVRGYWRVSTTSNFASWDSYVSSYVSGSGTATRSLSGFDPNKTYYFRCYAQDNAGVLSASYVSFTLTTYVAPAAPTLLTPADNVDVQPVGSVKFTWKVADEDYAPSNNTQIQWVLDDGSGDWTGATTKTVLGSVKSWTEPIGTFHQGDDYMWRVRTSRPNLWGAWAAPGFSFHVLSGVASPVPLTPSNLSGEDINDDITFTWKFRDPDPGDTQLKADIRYRPKGGTDLDWTIIAGDDTTPGAVWSWDITGTTFMPGVTYEWQVRTYDSGSGSGVSSAWSDSAFFIAVSVGSGAQDPVTPDGAIARGALGCGVNRAYIYDRGGKNRIGELTSLSQLSWGRVRDDISSASVTVDMRLDKSCWGMLENTRSMRHELVIFRDSGQGPQRVWEGPITRITYTKDQVTLAARDPMQYVYRRIMRQGYNDSYPNNRSVVYRAQRILVNALAIDDPNMLQYITAFVYDDDAGESRIRDDYASTAWEEVDDLAENAGLDYVTVGRRVLLWDTHRPIGRLPVMRDNDFGSALIVTEYGMSLCTRLASTNNSGVWGAYNQPGTDENGLDDYYGLVEILISSYSEASAADDTTLTPASLAALESTLASQAQRTASDRFPAPLVVRVPDNSTLSPDCQVDINYLIPGVWIPLQATDTPRKVTQWQKLDSMSVTQDSTGETVTVVMSPAPGAGADPDAADTGEDDGGGSA
jgi:hypothetical protein